jgi:hypothetical protein
VPGNDVSDRPGQRAGQHDEQWQQRRVEAVPGDDDGESAHADHHTDDLQRRRLLAQEQRCDDDGEHNLRLQQQ